MSESLTAMDTGAGILTLPSNSRLCDIAGAVPNKGWQANGEHIGAPAFFSIGVASVNSHTPLPRDVLDFLMSAVQFAEAVVQLDYAGSDRGTDRAVYRALAEIKHSLHKVTWSRELE
ncbi:MAG: hypothetical protein FJX40_08875 [Alphaproteobacteria bacterium]|nr:hypothetical protein [Alphaproteobacteria bacterium]